MFLTSVLSLEVDCFPPWIIKEIVLVTGTAFHPGSVTGQPCVCVSVTTLACMWCRIVWNMRQPFWFPCMPLRLLMRYLHGPMRTTIIDYMLLVTRGACADQCVCVCV